jgi:hypothetical protein
MKALEDLYEELRTCSSDAQREVVAERFVRLARENKARLTEFVETLPLDARCGLFEVYEALASDADSFHAFYVGELRRLLRAAERSPRNCHIYASLEAFAYLSCESDLLVRELKAILSGYMDTSQLPLRRFATWLIGDFIRPDSQQEIDKLFLAFRSDPDFRVRHLAYLGLREGPAADIAPTPGLLHRLRLMWVGTKLHDYVAS